jgi:hypothetical protein
VKIPALIFCIESTISILSVREQILRAIFAERDTREKHSVRPLLARVVTQPVRPPFLFAWPSNGRWCVRTSTRYLNRSSAATASKAKPRSATITAGLGAVRLGPPGGVETARLRENCMSAALARARGSPGAARYLAHRGSGPVVAGCAVPQLSRSSLYGAAANGRLRRCRWKRKTSAVMHSRGSSACLGHSLPQDARVKKYR